MATLKFENGFNGIYEVKDNKLILNKEDGLRPYDLIFGGIAGCFYSTFLEVLRLNNVSVESSEIVINGTKRKSIPTTLEYLSIHFYVKTNDDKKKVRDCFYEAIEVCSLIQTFKHVADIQTNISFKA
ncbi:MAG: OsmC family protein [Erysipelotrichaceae bacterium]|nr:OsmC family protein [Erysipelotrichaceae bacterium]